MLWMARATERFGEFETSSKFAVEADDEGSARLQALRVLAEWRADGGTREDENAFSFYGFETLVTLELVDPIPDGAAALAWVMRQRLRPTYLVGRLPDEGRAYVLDESEADGFRYEEE